MAVHDRSSDFTCWVCHEGFVNEASLGQHFSNSHPQNSPFHCATCDEDFISELFLQIHMSDYHSKIATNDDDVSNSPVATRNAEVAAESSSSSNIDFVTVKKEHLDQDNCFWCPVCFKGFSKKEDLRMHFHSDHVVCSNSMFVCELCGTGKPTAEMLCWHLEVHSISPYSVNKFSKLRLLLRKDVSMDTDPKKTNSKMSAVNVKVEKEKEDHGFIVQAFDNLLSDREAGSVSVMTGTKTPGRKRAKQAGNLNNSVQITNKTPSRKGREEDIVSISGSNFLDKSKIFEEEQIPLFKKSFISEGKQTEKVSVKFKNDVKPGTTKSSTKNHKHGSETNLEKSNALQTRSSINKIINNDHSGKNTDKIVDKSNDNVNVTLNDSCPLTLEELLSQHVEGITQIIPRQTNLIKNHEQTEMDSIACKDTPNENELDKSDTGVRGEVSLLDEEPLNFEDFSNSKGTPNENELDKSDSGVKDEVLLQDEEPFEDSNRKKLDDKEVCAEKVSSSNCEKTITRQHKSALKKKSSERTKGWLQRKHNRKLIINSKLINKKGKETEHKDIQIDTNESNKKQIENLTKIKEVDHFVELPLPNVDENDKDQNNLKDFQNTNPQEIKNLEGSCSPILEAKTKDAICSERDQICCDVTSKVLHEQIEGSLESTTVVGSNEVLFNKKVEKTVTSSKEKLFLSNSVENTLTKNIIDSDKNADQKGAVNKTKEDTFLNHTLPCTKTKKENKEMGDENAENRISEQPHQSSEALNQLDACTIIKNHNLRVMNSEEKDILNETSGSSENEHVSAEELGGRTDINSRDCLDAGTEEKICDADQKMNIATHEKLGITVKVKQAESLNQPVELTTEGKQADSFYKLFNLTAECTNEDISNITVKVAEEGKQEENITVKDIGIKLDMPLECTQEKGEEDINESQVKRKHKRLKTVEEGLFEGEGFRNQEKPEEVTEEEGVGQNSAIEQSANCEGLMKYFDFDDDDEKFVKTDSDRSSDSVKYQNLDSSDHTVSNFGQMEEIEPSVSERTTLRDNSEEMDKTTKKGEPTNQKSTSSQNMCDINDLAEVKDSNRTSDSSEEFSCSMCTLVFCDQDEFLDHVGTHLE